MTLNEIVEELARDKIFEEIINIFQSKKKKLIPHKEDLAQYLYLSLLQKKESFIVQLYENCKLRWFLFAMVSNSVNSRTSKYYYDEQRWEDKKIPMVYALDEDDEDF